MRVYHLCDANHGINNIALKRIKISRILDLNDPYELLGVNQRNIKLRKAFSNFKKTLHENHGLLCFSASWGNPVLWSHYADRHKGICLGFDVSDKLLLKVNYTNKLMDMELDKKSKTPVLSQRFMHELLVTKFTHWEYEEEYRIYVKLDPKTAEDGNYFYQYSDDLVLRDVIIGPRCVIPINTVRKLVENHIPSIFVTKSRVAFTKYKVVENRNVTRRGGLTTS